MCNAYGWSPSRLTAGVVLVLTGILTLGCSSTIHWESQVGPDDTLAIDAKQRLMQVGARVYYNEKANAVETKPVTCTEPSPDAIVAKAAAFGANANASGSQGAGAGGIAGSSSESAASIGYRDHTVQMLRDGYFRLCEAYMNGGLSDEAYTRVVRNVDTFMVVVSALQILGVNPVAPAVAISAGEASADAEALTTAIENAQGLIAGDDATTTATKLTVAVQKARKIENVSADNARAAEQIIKDFLAYRKSVAAAHEKEMRLRR